MAPHDHSSLAEYYLELAGCGGAPDERAASVSREPMHDHFVASSGTLAEALALDVTICDSDVVLDPDGDDPAEPRGAAPQPDLDRAVEPMPPPSPEVRSAGEGVVDPAARAPAPLVTDASGSAGEGASPVAGAAVAEADCPAALRWLKGAREANGVTLSHISQETKIPLHLLEQLECGDLAGWPRGIYGKAYARAYAIQSGLDAEEVVAVVAGCLPPEETLEEIRRAREDYDVARSRRAMAPMLDRMAVTPPQLAVLALGGVLLLALLTPMFNASANSSAPQSTPAARTYARPSHLRAEPPVQRRRTAPISGYGGALSRPESRAVAPVEAAPPPGSEGGVPQADATLDNAPVTPRLATLDVGEAAAFSPSFAGNGELVVYHAGAQTRGVLKAAQVGGDGSVIDVRTLMDDGSRNYHVRFSPDQRQVAFDSDRDGIRRVYVANSDGGGARQISGPGFAAIPSWSPDGQRVAFVRAEEGKPSVWNLWVMDLHANELQRLTSNTRGQPWGGSWLPDGRRLCYSLENSLVVLDTHTGESQTFTSPRQGSLARTPAVAPDGRRVIFQVYRDGVWILDLQDGSMRRVLDDRSAEEFNWSPDGKRVAFHSRRDGGWKLWVMEL